MTLWTAGFDIIYACQDYEFDVAEGLFSYPRRFGIAGALAISRVFHILMLALPAGAGLRRSGWGRSAWRAWRRWPLLLAYEHSLVKPHDLSRVNAAFFTVNGYVSVLFFVFWAADILLLRSGA